MAEQDITTVFKADISQFKKAISEAYTEIKKINADFKTASAATDDWRTSTDGLSAKLKQLKDLISQQETRIQAYKNIIGELQTAYQKNNTQREKIIQTMREMKDAGQDETDEYKKLEKALKRVEDTLSANEKSQEDYIITIKNTEATVAELNRDMKKYENQLDSLKYEHSEAGQSAKQLAEKMEDVDEATSRAGEGFTVLKGVLANLITDGIQRATQAVKDFVTTSINMASDIQEVQNVVDVTFGDSANVIDDFAKKAGNAYGMTILSAKEYTGTLGALIKSTGVAEDQIAEMSTNLVAMAGDFASFYNLDHSEAFEKIRAGIAGETEPLRQLGINMTVANMEAYALSKGIETAWRNMTYAEQTTLRYNYIMEKGQLAAGDFARTLDESLANQLRVASLNMDNLRITIGNKLYPVVMRAVRWFNDFSSSLDIEKVASKAADGLDKVWSGFQWLLKNKQVITTTLGGIAAGFVAAKVIEYGKAITGLATIWKVAAQTGILASSATKALTIAQEAETLATGKATLATNLFNAAWKANPIGIVATAVGLLVAGLVLLSSKTKEATAEEQEHIDALHDVIDTYEDYESSLTDTYSAMDETTKAAETQAGKLDYLGGRLLDLKDKENKSNEEKAEMKRLVDELNEVYPDLNAQYDEEADKLNLSTEAIEKNIDAQKNLLLAKAAEENLSKIADKIAEADYNRVEALAELEEAQAAYSKSIEENGDVLKEWEEVAKVDPESANGFYDANKQIIDAQSELKRVINESQEVVEGYEKDIESLNKTYEKTGNLASDYAEKADISGAFAKLQAEMDAAGRTLPEAISKGIESGMYAVPESLAELDKLILFDGALEKAGYAGKEIPKYLSDGIMSGDIDIVTAMQELEELLKIPDKAEELKAQGKVIPENFAEGVESGKYSLEQAQQVIDTAMNWDKIVADATEKGAKIPANLAESIKSGSVSVADARQMIEDSIAFAELSNDANEAGIDVSSKLAEGIESGSITPATAIETLNNAILNSFQGMLIDAELAGAEVPKQVSEGIRSGEMSIADATEAMNNWIEFSEGIEEANEAGLEIPQKLSDGIVSGEMSVSTAVDQMKNLINFSDKIDELGLQGLEIPTSLAEKIMSGTPLTEDAANQLINAIETQISDGTIAFEGLGADAIAGYVKGLTNSEDRDEVGEAAKEAVLSGIDAAKDAQDSNSPSVVYQGLGEDAMDGYILGIRNKSGEMGNAVADGILAGASGVESASNFIKSILLKAFTLNLSAQGRTVITTYVGGINSGKGSVSASANGLKSTLINGVKVDLSPYGRNAGGTFANGFNAMRSRINSIVVGIRTSVTNTLKLNLSSQGSGAGSSYASGISSQSGNVYSASSLLKSKVISGVSGLYGKMYAEGENGGDGLRNGLLSKAQSIANAAAQIVRNAIDAAKHEQDSHSPSKVWENEIGKMAGQGFINGLSAMVKPAVSSGKNLISKTISSTKQSINNLMKKGYGYDFESAGKKLAEKFEKAITNNLNTNKSNLTKQVDKYFEKYEKKYTDAINDLQKQIDKTSDKNKKKQLQNQLSELKTQLSNFKKLYSQVGKEMEKQFGSAMSTATKKVTDKLSSNIESITKKMQEELDAINKSIESMRSKLSDYGDLFTTQQDPITKQTEYTVTNLKDQINVLKQYNKNLTALKGKISDSLMEEITSLGVDEAIGYTEKLLAMSSKELSDYNKLYTQKLNLAKSISNKFYADSLKEVKTKYTDKMTQAFKDATTQIQKLGQQAIEGFLKGMSSVKVDGKIKDTANAIINAMKKSLKISSPSKVFMELGEFSGEGYLIGLADAVKNAKAGISSILPNASEMIGGETGNIATTNITNYYQTINSPKAVSRIDLYRQTRNLLAYNKGGI